MSQFVTLYPRYVGEFHHSHLIRQFPSGNWGVFKVLKVNRNWLTEKSEAPIKTIPVDLCSSEDLAQQSADSRSQGFHPDE